MPKLSVIVPVYNTEKYLRECLESILGQTFRDFELILVDDGSTDRSGEICDEYAKIDHRIRVVHQKNKGVTLSRKVGVELAKGDYVTFVDSDDWIDQDTYFNILTNIERYHADIGIFAIKWEKKTPVIIRNSVEEGFFSKESLKKNIYPKMLFDYSANGSGIIATLCNKVIRREILQKEIAMISDDLEYGEDAIAGYLCILKAEIVIICNAPFYHYRDNPSSISHAALPVMRKRILTLDKEMRNCFSGYSADLSSQINGHIARHTVEQVRNELLYSFGQSFFERRRAVRTFCEHPQIAVALEEAFPKICNKKEKIKVLFIRFKLFGLLYLLFKKI